MAARAVSVLVNSIVGPGIRPRAASGDSALNRKVDDLWKAWSAHCDAEGHTRTSSSALEARRERWLGLSEQLPGFR